MGEEILSQYIGRLQLKHDEIIDDTLYPFSLTGSLRTIDN